MTLTPREFVFYVHADLDTVWAALTTEEGLACWYAVDAKVDLEEGGALSLDWGTGDNAMGHFDVVEKPTRLRLVYEHQDGEPTGSEEWLLAHDRGVTHVRLIHSLPVADGATWDDTYPGIVRGWALFMTTLKWVLDGGKPLRRTAEPVIGRLTAGAWPRVIAALGLDATPQSGDTVATAAGPAEVLVGTDGYSLLLAYEAGATLLVDVEGDSLYTVAASYGDQPGLDDLRAKLAAVAADMCAAAGH